MLWFFLSLLTALSVAARDVSVKAFRDMPPLEIAWVELSYSLPILLAIFFLVPTPHLDHTFWWALIISLPLNGLAYLLYLHALKLSPLSLTVPFLSFTPVFMIFTGFLTLGESINFWGGTGTGMIVIGSYILNISKARQGILKPITALLHEKGSWLMLIVAMIFAFAAVIGKKGMIHSSPLYFSVLFFLVFNISILFSLLLIGKAKKYHLWERRGRGIWFGGLLTLHICCHGLAITASTAVYMMAVKRSSILFSVILSWLFLKETHILERGFGMLFMLCGVILIVFLG